MKPIPLLTAIAVVAVLFLLVFQRDALDETLGVADTPEEVTTPAPDSAPADGAVSVIAMHSRAGELDSAVVLRGLTEADRSVSLAAETSGRVISHPTPKGTLVSEGDVLCRLDPGTREASLSEARAVLTEAEVNLRNTEKLAEGGYASETALISARAGLESARAAVAGAEAEIDRLTITAPFGGLLESDTAELGSLLQTGSACATIVALDPIRLVGFVSEVEVDRVIPGAPVMARLASGREIAGTITFVSRSADSQTRTFRVEAQAANPDLTIRDGQTADILIAASGRMAHIVPQSALTLDDDGNLGLRLVTAEGTARFAPVEMLRDTPEGVWVTGLPDQANIIVTGQEYVSDGTPLTVTWTEDAAQ